MTLSVCRTLTQLYPPKTTQNFPETLFPLCLGTWHISEGLWAIWCSTFLLTHIFSKNHNHIFQLPFLGHHAQLRGQHTWAHLLAWSLQRHICLEKLSSSIILYTLIFLDLVPKLIEGYFQLLNIHHDINFKINAPIFAILCQHPILFAPKYNLTSSFTAKEQKGRIKCER